MLVLKSKIMITFIDRFYPFFPFIGTPLNNCTCIHVRYACGKCINCIIHKLINNEDLY